MARSRPSKIKPTGDAQTWRRFSTDSPPLEDLIQIRRLHDNKTILRRRADLPPTFGYKTAEWRPL